MRQRRPQLVLRDSRLVVLPEQVQLPLVPLPLGHASAAIWLPPPLEAERPGVALYAGPRSLRQELEQSRCGRVVEVLLQRLVFLGRPTRPFVHEGAMDDHLLDPTAPPDEPTPDPLSVMADEDPVQRDAREELALQVGREPPPLGPDVREEPSHPRDLVGGQGRSSRAARAVQFPQAALLLGHRVLEVGMALGCVLLRAEERFAVRLQCDDFLLKRASAPLAVRRLRPMLLVLHLQMPQHGLGLLRIRALPGDQLDERSLEDVGRDGQAMMVTVAVSIVAVAAVPLTTSRAGTAERARLTLVVAAVQQARQQRRRE